MADSVGIDRRTGKLLTDWDHVVQSLEVILTTRVITRVMRREFGSDVPKLIDAPSNDLSLLMFYVAAAEAVDRWEPRFELLEVNFEQAGPDGRTALLLMGNYLPRGHLGDRTPEEQRTKVFDFVQLAELGLAAAMRGTA